MPTYVPAREILEGRSDPKLAPPLSGGYIFSASARLACLGHDIGNRDRTARLMATITSIESGVQVLAVRLRQGPARASDEVVQ